MFAEQDQNITSTFSMAVCVWHVAKCWLQKATNQPTNQTTIRSKRARARIFLVRVAAKGGKFRERERKREKERWSA